MASVNAKIFDATIRRRIQVLRFSEGEAEQVSKALHEIELDLLDQLGSALARGLSTTRINSMLVSTRRAIRDGFSQVSEDLGKGLDAFGEVEAAWERDMLTKASAALDLEFATAAIDRVLAAVRAPIQGIQLDGWLRNIEDSTKLRFEQAIRVGVAQGETVDQLVARVRGTPEAAYRDAILAKSRREAESLVRTAVSHVSTQAREQVWLANSDLILALRWTSVLDGHTTAMCQSRDGKLAPLMGLAGTVDLSEYGEELDPPYARTPGHWQCRSDMVPVLNPIEAAKIIEPMAGRKTRDMQIRQIANSRGMSLDDAKRVWVADKLGDVPSKQSYGQWLAGQSAAFQDEVLGKARADMFRNGASLDKFVDFSGRRLRLSEL